MEVMSQPMSALLDRNDRTHRGLAAGVPAGTPHRRVFQDLRPDPAELRALLWGLLAALVARGALFFTPILSTDDFTYYATALVADEARYVQQVSSGRYLFWLTLHLHDWLGTMPPQVFTLLGLLTQLAAMALFIVASRTWRLDAPARSLLTAAFAVYPLLAEYFHFFEAQLAYAIAFLGTLLFVVLSRRAADTAAVAALIVAILAYPIAVHYALVIVVLDCFALYLVVGSPRAALLGSRLPQRIAGVLVATVLVVVLWKLLLALTGVGASERASLLAPSELPARLGLALGAAADLVIGKGVPIPDLLQLVTLAGWLFALATLWRRPAAMGLALLTFLAALVCAFGTILLVGIWWPTPRALGAFALLALFPLAILMSTALPAARWAGHALATATLLIGCWAGNAIVHDGLALRSQESALVNRITARLETLPGFHRAMPLAVVAGWPGVPVQAPRTSAGDLNVSALVAPWARLGLFNRTTGYAFSQPENAQLALAQARCASSEPWPAPASVAIEDGLAIVCITRPGGA
jgi:hypothetical protein